MAYLLEGSVRRSGEILRITSDLIDGSTGFSRWSDTFDRVMQDIFAVQIEIANTVASKIGAKVGLVDRTDAGDDPPEAAPGGTTSVAAYDAYLRGRALYDLSVDETSERAALAQFDAAIEADPQYAAAHAARARSLTAIANQYGEVGELAGLYDAAVASAERASRSLPILRRRIRHSVSPFSRDGSTRARHASHSSARAGSEPARRR